MTTRITILFLLISIGNLSQANVPVPFWLEDFGLGQLPAGWEVEDSNVEDILWEHCDDFNNCAPLTFGQAGILPPRRFESFSMDNGYAFISPFGQGSATDTHSSSLTTKSIDCSNKLQVFVMFNTHIVTTNSSPQYDAILQVKHGEFGDWFDFPIFHHLDHSTVETDAQERLRSYNGQAICINISSVAAGNEDVKIRWRWDWTGDNEYFWLIDDVNLVDSNPINDKAIWGTNPTEGDFAGGLNDWNVVQSGDCAWEWSADGLVDYPDPNDLADAYSCSCSIGNGMALINPTCSTSNTFSELISPIIDLSTYTGGKRLGLAFNQSGAMGNGASSQLPVTSVMVSVDGGATFSDTTYLNLNEPFSKPFCNSKRIVLPEEVSQTDQFLFKFVFAGNTFFWSIDDVRIIELHDYDLKISSDYFTVPPNYATPVKLIEPISFGAEVQNVGNLPQENVKLMVHIFENISQVMVFQDTLYIGEMAPGDVSTEAYFANRFTPPNVPMEYTCRYSVDGNFTDEELIDNKVEFQFKVGGSVISKQIDNHSINGGFTPVGNTVRYEVGNCFFIPPGVTDVQGVAVQYALANAIQLAPSNVTIKANLYKWKTEDSYGDANGDLKINEDEYEEATIAYFTLDDETLRLRDIIEIGFNENVTLEDSTYYFVTVEYFAPAIWPNNQEIPFFISASEEVNYAAMADQYNHEGRPRYTSVMRVGTNTEFQINAWGHLRIPFVQLVIDETTSSVEAEENKTSIHLFPNPASDWMVIEINKTSPIDAVEIYDICGRLVQSRQYESAFVSQLPINVSNLINGIYTLRVYSESEFKAHKFMKTDSSK